MTRRLRLGGAAAPRGRARAPAPRSARCCGSRGAREVLLAQTLWVLAYAALPGVLHPLRRARRSSSDVGIAGALPLAFGAFIALGMALAGRARPERVHGLLLTGAALLGAGLLAAAPHQPARGGRRSRSPPPASAPGS